MPALPSPSLLPGPLADLLDALHELHRRAGRPSLRRMAVQVGCSHTTISSTFSLPRLPRWDLLELVVEALGGDTEEFHTRWLAADAQLLDRPAAAAPTGGRSAVVPQELPPRIEPYVGREAELARLDDLLDTAESAGGSRVVLITGSAGVGKTCCAVMWAHSVAARYPDGQLFLDLRGYDVSRPRSAAGTVEATLRRLGVDPTAIPRDLDDRTALLRSVLANRRMLIILDNAHSADQVVPLVPGSWAGFVVVTSRNGLPALVSRIGAGRLQLSRMGAEQSAILLGRLIGRPAGADDAALHQLARRCAYLPLALRVAAEVVGRDADLPLPEQVARFDSRPARLDLLDAGGDRHTGVRTVFSWSLRRLSPRAARLFELLGASPARDLDRAAAAALLGDPQDVGLAAVEELRLAHLVEPRGDAIGLHDLLRDYAAELVAQRPEAERKQARRRLFDHYLRRVEQIESDESLGDWLRSNRPSLVVVTRAAAAESPWHCIRLATLLHGYLETAGYYGDAIVVGRAAVEAAEATADRRALAAALARTADALRRSGSTAESLAAAERARILYESLADPEGIAGALTAAAAVHVRRGDNQLACDELRRAIELYRERGDRVGEASASNRLGIALLQLGQLAESRRSHQRAYDLYGDLGVRLARGRAANNLGVLEIRIGELTSAREHLEEALQIATEVGNQAGIGVALANLGDVAERRHRYNDAIELYRDGIEVCARIGYLGGLADASRGLGLALARRGEHDAAMRALNDALDVGRQAGDRDVETATLNDLGVAERLHGGDGTAHHRDALAAATQTGDVYQKARALDGLGRAASTAGDLATARRHWQRALVLFDRLGVPEATKVAARLAAEPAADAAVDQQPR